MDFATEISELRKRIESLELEVQALRANRGIAGIEGSNHAPSMIPKPPPYALPVAKENRSVGAVSSNLKSFSEEPTGRRTLAPRQLADIITAADVQNVNLKPVSRSPGGSIKRKNSDATTSTDSELQKKLYQRYVSTAMSTGENDLYPKKKD